MLMHMHLHINGHWEGSLAPLGYFPKFYEIGIAYIRSEKTSSKI